MLNEKQMRYLLTIAEEQNITAAARKLYLSQPALSRMLLELEKELGSPLFVRDRGTLRLTQTGEIYLKGCREILNIDHSMIQEISDRNGSRGGKILLGVTSLTGEYLVPRILNDFEQAFPGVELELVEERANDLPELVSSGKVDVSLVYRTDDPELEYQILRKDPIHIQVPPFFSKDRPELRPGVENPPLNPKELDGQPMILLRKGRGMRKMAEQMFEQFQIKPGHVIETENIHIANSLVRLNRGFTLVPDFAAHRFFYADDGSIYCSVKGAHLERNMYACTRRGDYRTRAERYLMELVASAPSAKDEL